MSSDYRPIGLIKRWLSRENGTAPDTEAPRAVAEEPGDVPLPPGPPPEPGVEAPLPPGPLSMLPHEEPFDDSADDGALDPVAPVPLEAEMPEAPTAPPRFEARAYWMPKMGDHEDEWEDAFAFDPARGRAAVADGASEGIFSRLWADLLARGVVDAAIDPGDPEALAGWLPGLRAEWMRAIDFPGRRYTQQMKVDQTGAAATLLVFQMLPDARPGEPSESDARPWRAWAVGDSCLIQIREGRLLTAFPVTASADFGIAPALLRTRAGTAIPPLQETEGTCEPGDVILLATDAVAQAILSQIESGADVDWSDWIGLDLDTWRSGIDDLRARRQIVNDDCTLVVLTPVE